MNRYGHISATVIFHFKKVYILETKVKFMPQEAPFLAIPTMQYPYIILVLNSQKQPN